MPIEKDFEEFFACLNKHKVRYCIIGAFALAYHARPRYTKDIDAIIEPSRDNAVKILQALADFGFPITELTEEDFSQPDQILQLGHEPVRIDLVTSISGCSFDDVWKNKVNGHYGSVPVSYIGREELIRNKTASARPQDLVDVGTLQEFKKER